MLKKKFDAGEKDPAFLKNFMKVFMFSEPELAEKAAVKYFEDKKGQPLSNEDFSYLFGIMKESSSPLFKIMEERKTEITQVIPEASYQGMVKNLKLNTIMKQAYHKETKKIDENLFLTEAEKMFTKEESQNMLLKTKMTLAAKNKDYATYQNLALSYYGNGTDPKFTASELNTVAWNFFENINDKQALSKAILWATEGSKKGESYAITDTVANLYMKTGDKKNTKIWAEKAIELAKKHGEDYESTQEILDKLK